MNVLKYGGTLRYLINQRQIALEANHLRRCISCLNKQELLKSNKQFVSTYEVKNISKSEGAIGRLLEKIPFLKVNKLKIKAAGYLLYETIADKLDYPAFFEEFDLPDTFYSWFVITELYIWMLSTRAMAEGEDGQLLRNSIVEAFWLDVSQRIKKLGPVNTSLTRQQISELSDQLHAALIGYDEGLHFDDITLAGALWRRIYQTDAVHPEYLEKLVKHVRKQIKLLDNISSDHLFISKNINWLPISNEN